MQAHQMLTRLAAVEERGLMLGEKASHTGLEVRFG